MGKWRRCNRALNYKRRSIQKSAASSDDESLACRWERFVGDRGFSDRLGLGRAFLAQGQDPDDDRDGDEDQAAAQGADAPHEGSIGVTAAENIDLGTWYETGDGRDAAKQMPVSPGQPQSSAATTVPMIAPVFFFSLFSIIVLLR